MGVINHKIGVVITFCDDTNLDLFEAVVKDINAEWWGEFKDFGALISSSGVQCNGFIQFTFNVCGSKEGWKENNRASDLMERFFRAAHTLLALDRCVLITLPEEGPMDVGGV